MAVCCSDPEWIACLSAGARSTASRREHDVPSRSEDAARAALEVRYGRPLSESEWQSAKRDLLDFIRLLAQWNGRRSGASPSGVLDDISGPTGLLL